MECDNPKKFKMALQKFLYENSFYSLDEYFSISESKRQIYIRSFFLPHKDNVFPFSPTTNLYYKSICIYNYINVTNQYFLAQKVLLKDCLVM